MIGWILQINSGGNGASIYSDLNNSNRKEVLRQQEERNRKIAQQEERDRKMARQQQEEEDRKIAQQYALLEKVGFDTQISISLFF